MVKGTSLIRDPDIMRLRDMQMLNMKVQGASQKEIAAYFNISIDTVERAFSRIKQQGLARLAEDRLMETVVPAAIDRFLTAITTENDTQAALEVLKGLGVLKKQATARGELPGPGGAQEEDDSLLIYMRKTRATNTHREEDPADVVFDALSPTDTERIQDGAFQEAEPSDSPSAPPSGVTGAGENGLSARDESVGIPPVA